MKVLNLSHLNLKWDNRGHNAKYDSSANKIENRPHGYNYKVIVGTIDFGCMLTALNDLHSSFVVYCWNLIFRIYILIQFFKTESRTSLGTPAAIGNNPSIYFKNERFDNLFEYTTFESWTLFVDLLMKINLNSCDTPETTTKLKINWRISTFLIIKIYND